MEVIKIEEIGYTPGVTLDAEKGIFELTGKACPEDAVEFFQPIMDWIDQYKKNPNPKTVFDFRLSYYNTASSKILLNIMQRLEEMKRNGADILIRWFHFEDDEELLNAGEDFSEMIKVPFEIIATE